MPRLPATKMNRQRSARQHRAFSLIELVVGVSILLVMVVMLSRLVLYGQEIWSATEAKKEILQTERAVSYFIERELQSALLPINRPSQTSLQFVVNPTSVSATYRNRDAFFWQTPLASNPAMGDVAEVGYFVRWDLSTPGNPRSMLCRLYVNPSSPNYKIHTDPTAWISDTMLEAVAPAVKTNADDSYMGLFAENVLGLWVRCLDSSGNMITKNEAGSDFTGASYDSRQGYTDSLGVVKSRGALPVAVDFSLVLLDSRTARRIGPAEQAAILGLTSSASVASAAEFVTQAASLPVLEKLKGGLRPFQLRTYLQGSK